MILLLGFFASSETLLWVYVLVFFISVTTQFFVPAEAPTIPRLVPGPLLLTANSLFTFTYYLSMITGFILAGPMLRHFGPHNVFIFLALLLALSAYFVSRIPAANNNHRQGELNKSRIVAVWHEFLAGLRFIKKQKEIFISIVLLASSQAIIACLASLAPGFADRILKIQLEDASYIIMGPAAIGMVVGCLLVGQFGRHQDKKKLITVGIIFAGLTLFALSAMFRLKNLPLAFLFLLGLGGANALIDVPANTTIQENASEELRGRVYGVLASLVGGAAILPVIITGVMADLLGIGKTIFLIACLISAYGINRLMKARYNLLKI
jgi:MFS family permease